MEITYRPTQTGINEKRETKVEGAQGTNEKGIKKAQGNGLSRREMRANSGQAVMVCEKNVVVENEKMKKNRTRLAGCGERDKGK